MRAVSIHSARSVHVETVPDPALEHVRDALVRVTAASIGGWDLHAYNGLLPHPRAHVPGHELVGVVQEVGAGVKALRRGDRVVVPFAAACGTCWFCERGFTTHCNAHRGPKDTGGHSGAQAHFVRVPFADFGARRVPDGVSDDDALLLSDLLPTAYAGLRWAQLQQGERVVVWGCGGLGLMAMKLARAMGAAEVIAVDVLPHRLEMARKIGGAVAVDATSHDAVETVRQLTGGRGADVGIEAVGIQPERTLKERLLSKAKAEPVLARVFSAVRPGGRVSVLGMYPPGGETLPLAVLNQRGLRVSAGPAPVHALIDELMQMVRVGRVKTDEVITHRFPLERAPHAYELCSRKTEGCVKVSLDPWAG